METVKWVKAAGCESTTCIEIAPADRVWRYTPEGADFAIRATELDGGEAQVIWATEAELRAFLAGVKKGDFDFLLEE